MRRPDVIFGKKITAAREERGGGSVEVVGQIRGGGNGIRRPIENAGNHSVEQHLLGQQPDRDNRPHCALEPAPLDAAEESGLPGGLRRVAGTEPRVLQRIPSSQPLHRVLHQQLGDEVFGGLGHGPPHGRLQVDVPIHNALEDVFGGSPLEGAVAPKHHEQHHPRAPHVHGAGGLDGSRQGAAVRLALEDQLRGHVLERAHQEIVRAVEVRDVC
mmetsp:Transcript_761/g.1354  ORF Transcript_761/g.1354 Transcript_761/m.1354 type:complete len:214 (-) Transcript_761:2030-2671(-)